MTNQRKVTMNTGEQTIAFARQFEGLAARVFEAHTDATLVEQWIAPRGTELTMRSWDARTGGRSYVVAGLGGEWTFHGLFHEVAAPSRLVQTFEFEGAQSTRALGDPHLHRYRRRASSYSRAVRLPVSRGPGCHAGPRQWQV